jgi:hypothetical protein
MPVAPKTSRLTDDQLKDLLRLAKGADSIELKLTVPASGQRSALTALGIDPLDAQIRQIYFYDTPDLALYNSGLNLRARRVQGKGEDSVVKIRPVDPEHIDAELRVSPNMKVEVDAMPGGYVCSASLKGKPSTGDTRNVHFGQEPIRRLFSKEQREFFESHAPEGVSWDDLVVLGPIFALKVVATPKGFDRKITAEMWFYPDGKRLLELSLKCPPGETMQAATEARLFFGDLGIDLLSAQETKTRSTLQFFAKEIVRREAESNGEGEPVAEPAEDGAVAVAAVAEAAPANGEPVDAMAELESNGTSDGTSDGTSA